MKDDRSWMVSIWVCAALAIGLLCSTTANAGTATIRAEEKYLWYLGSPTPMYDSPEAAFAAVQARYAEGCSRPGAMVRIEVFDFRPKPGAALINGAPTQYIWSWSSWFCANGQPQTVNSTEGTIAVAARCPDAPGWTTVVKAAGTGPSDQIRWCEKVIATPEPCPGQCRGWVGNPIHAATGIKKQVEVDYQSTGGLLKFERTYRSDTGRFTSAIASSGLYDYSPAVGRLGGCVSERYVRDSSAGLRSSYCFPLMSAAQPDAMLWTEEGRLIDFDSIAGAMKPNANVNDRLVKSTDGQGQVQWWLTRANNTLEVYSSGGALLSRTTADGKSAFYERSTSATPTSIAPYPGLVIAQTDSFGRSLRFAYSDAGLMIRMTDPDDQPYLYAYDKTSLGCASGACDRVVRVEFPGGLAREYLYNETAYVAGQSPNPPLLTGINEIWPETATSPSKTVRIGTYGYDAYGKANLTESANGLNRYSTVFPTGLSVRVTDPLGTQRTTTFTTLLNTRYLTGDSQPAGSGSAAGSNATTYDANGNVASSNDFKGNRSCYSHDLGRNLEVVRVEGLAGTATCSTYTAANATLPAGARKTSTQWHPDWRLTTKRAEPRRITSSIYNGLPDPFNGNAIASCVPSTAILPDRKPIAVLCKKVEQATTDADGAQGFGATIQAGVESRVWEWTYNEYGQVLTERDPLNNQTSNIYYATTTADYTRGDLQQSTNAAGHATQYPKYNKHGQVLQMVDANGVVTDYTYDLRQRLKTVTTGGQTTSHDYDAVGQLKKVTQGDGSHVAYDYDDARRLIAVSDSAGNRIDYTLDNAGNRTAENVKDPSGALKRQLARAMDALGRVQQTTGRE